MAAIMSRRQFLNTGIAATAGTALALSGKSSRFVTAAPAVQGTTKLRIMVWGRPDAANWNYEAYKQVKPDAAQNLTIDPVIGGPGDLEVAEQFRLMLSAGGADVPDIIRFDRLEIPEFAAADVLTDLTDMIAPFKSDMIDSAVGLASFNDRIVGIPAQLKSKVWYYRHDLFEKAGVSPDNVKTLDDFIAAGKQLHDKLPKSFIFNLRAAPQNYTLQDVGTSYAPISFFNRDSGQYQITTHPGFRAMFDALDKLRDPAVSAPVDDFSPDWAPAFESDTIASSLITEWMTGYLPQYVPDQAGRWAVHAWPNVGSSNKGGEGGAVWVIPKQAKNPQAAFEFLSTVHLTKEGALAVLGIGGLTPYIKSARAVVPAMKKPDVATPQANPVPWPPDFFGSEYFPVLFGAQERLAWIDYDPRSAKEMSLLEDWSQRFMAKQADVDGALQGLQGDLEAQIGDPWQM